MVGETEAKWRDTVRRALELQPDSLTIYQMELPYNTIISQEILEEGCGISNCGLAHQTRWLNYAFDEFQAEGYRIASAYTLATTKKPCRFIYTDALWHGGDMIGLGVSSFSHFGGVSISRMRTYFEEYLRVLNRIACRSSGRVTLTSKQRLIREMVLQLKTGALTPLLSQQVWC